MTSTLHTLEKPSMHQVKYLIYENPSDCLSEHPLHFCGILVGGSVTFLLQR
jgi:hypothetical protein